jgi:hypothetical protein
VTSNKELERNFIHFGKVLDGQVMLDRETGRTCGFGFMNFIDMLSVLPFALHLWTVEYTTFLNWASFNVSEVVD